MATDTDPDFGDMLTRRYDDPDAWGEGLSQERIEAVVAMLDAMFCGDPMPDEVPTRGVTTIDLAPDSDD